MATKKRTKAEQTVAEGKDVPKLGEVIRDPATYAEMVKPRTVEEAAQATAAFFADVRELRIKHRIADTVTVASVVVDKVGPMTCYAHNGDSANVLPMLAQAFGSERKRLDAALDASLGVK